jgi:NADPH2:quinone reductase
MDNQQSALKDNKKADKPLKNVKDMLNAVLKIQITHLGGPEVLTFETSTEQAPGQGEVWIEQSAIGVNYVDIQQRKGERPLPLPSGLGFEAAGRVTAVGPGVTNISVDDRVAYAGGAPGAYATGRLYPSNRLVRIPDKVTDVEAASVLLKGITAQYLIKSTYPVGKGTVMLLYGAAGGVGQIIASWAKHLGARVIGVVSNNQTETALAAGCDEALIWGAVDVAAEVTKLTAGKKADVVYDPIGRATFETSLKSLRTRGMLVSFGISSGVPKPVDMSQLWNGSLFLTAPTIFDYIGDAVEYHQRAQDVFSAVAAEIIKPPLWKTFPFTDAALAHDAIERKQTSGAVVLKI